MVCHIPSISSSVACVCCASDQLNTNSFIPPSYEAATLGWLMVSWYIPRHVSW
jgi:hypothetical protein